VASEAAERSFLVEEVGDDRELNAHSIWPRMFISSADSRQHVRADATKVMDNGRRLPSGRDILSDWFSTTPASSQARGAMMSTLACGQEGRKWLLNNVPSHHFPRKAVYRTLQWLLTSPIVRGPSIGLCMQRIRHRNAPVVHGLGTELPAAHTASIWAPTALLQIAHYH
jgi:hypothetical protein